MRHRIILIACGVIALPSHAAAGMPAPLPDFMDPEMKSALTGTALGRIQAISFFLMAFLLCAAGVRWLWNLLQRDFPSLPRLGYGKALAGTFLWGLLFLIVLTMISGARELMTPGAWEKKGITYQLAGQPPATPEPDSETLRRRHLEELRTALWQFAATHEGRFPSAEEVSAIPTELWELPGAAGLRYIYVPGKTAGYLPEPLAYEPEIDADGRFVLRTNGDIVLMSSAELREVTP